MEQPTEPTEPTNEVPQELVDDVESAFVDALNVPDEYLPVIVEALHGFLDALTPKPVHDERMHALGHCLDGIPEGSESHVYADALRTWVVDTKNVVVAVMKAAGLDRSGIWVLHARIGGFLQWVLDADKGFGQVSGH